MSYSALDQGRTVMRSRLVWLPLVAAVVLMGMLMVPRAHARQGVGGTSHVGARAQPAKPQPAKPQPAKPQPAKSQPTKSQPSQPTKSQPTKSQPTKSQPAGTQPKGSGGATPPPGGKKAAPADEDLELGSSAPMGGAARESELYGDRLDGLQREIDGLKDRVFRSKARLALLRETVLRGVMAGSRVILAHRNLMGSGFRLVKIVYLLDGAQIYARSDDTGALDSEDELLVYDGNLPPGPHTVTVELTYNGHGYGVFSYLSSYTFESRSSHTFVAPEDGSLKIASSGFERGNITSEMKDRPSVDFREIPLDASGKPLPTTRRKRSK